MLAGAASGAGRSARFFMGAGVGLNMQETCLNKNERRRKPTLIAVVFVIVSALLLSAIWKVPYIDTLVGFAALAMLGHLITVDEELPGGWSNPDGKRPFPWHGLGVKAIVLVVLGACAIFFPDLRKFGA
jgi:hypothetical protein